MAILKVFMDVKLGRGYVVLIEEFSVNQQKIHPMKLSRPLTLISFGALLLFAGCSTPSSRIKSHQAAFDALPTETQAAIRAGKVEFGYTQEMVLMALGKPDRRYSRTTQSGQTEVWAYRDRGPAFSLGLGVGGGSGRTGVGGGIGVSTAGDRDEDKMRVIFDVSGKVSAIEKSSR
jgi:hypothetical protein